MSLNGIDISDYQKGIDLVRVPFDFMICKATEGTSIVHSTCDHYIQTCKKLGKLWGFYHFMNKVDPIAQADYFYKHCKNYFGHGVPVLDYEMYGRIGADGAKKFLDRIYELTGVRCIVYMSRSVCTEEDWSDVAKDYALWVAQYADNSSTGYQGDPWLPGGSFGAWKSCAIHQYSSHGRLDGYNGDLDLDIAFMTPEAWMKFANPGGAKKLETESKPTASDPSGSTLDLAAAVMRGEYGSGDTRKQRLGSRYSEVQDFINHIASASASTLAEEVKAGKYGNGDARRQVLGSRYGEVQAIVNQRAGVGSAKVYTVKSGDTLSGIGASLGVDWHTIARENGISSPYTIYPGQKLSY